MEKEVNPSQLLPKHLQNLQAAQNCKRNWKTMFKQNSRNKHTVSFQQEIPGANYPVPELLTKQQVLATVRELGDWFESG